jgi:precorrin-3B methylase
LKSLNSWRIFQPLPFLAGAKNANPIAKDVTVISLIDMMQELRTIQQGTRFVTQQSGCPY